jgi:glycyl-tRNA synthetase
LQTSAELARFLSQRRAEIEDLLKHRFFYKPSFDIYGGISGLYDYGPPGCALKREVEEIWRQHFILEEDMLEVSCTALTPEAVLIASGHVERFSDLMVKDSVTDAGYRADKLVRELLEVQLVDVTKTEEYREEVRKAIRFAETYNAQQMHEAILKFNIKAPKTDNELTFPEPFNLMFGTLIGPTGKHQGYLRPETAQGIFVNFKFLLDYNRQRLPFAAAQIGSGFRNEVSPRDGLLRVREFTMAEIEHFVNPKKKDHPKFRDVAHLVLNLFPQEQQETGSEPIEVQLGDAVSSRMINNETLGYFIGRTYLFLTKIGVRPYGIRFRQHMKDEMAHYASDCWDCEILTSYGWVECVGIADRSCYDLTKHAEASKKNLFAAEVYPEPIFVDVVNLNPNKAKIAQTFKKDTQAVIKALETLGDCDKEAALAAIQANSSYSLAVGDLRVELTPEMIRPVKEVTKISQETFYPGVIEPSFGIGRVLYALMEHSYSIREDVTDQRAYLEFPATVAPIKVSILPLSNNDAFIPLVLEIKQNLTKAGLSNDIDDSSQSIGRRYARRDEIGTPYAVTVDFQTVEDRTVTLREVTGMTQVRLPVRPT